MFFKYELGNGVFATCASLKKLLTDLVFEAEFIETDLPENTLSIFSPLGVCVIKFPLRLASLADDLETLIHTVDKEWC